MICEEERVDLRLQDPKSIEEGNGKPGDCIGCGKCERIYPQHLPIRNNLKLVASQFVG